MASDNNLGRAVLVPGKGGVGHMKVKAPVLVGYRGPCTLPHGRRMASIPVNLLKLRGMPSIEPDKNMTGPSQRALKRKAGTVESFTRIRLRLRLRTLSGMTKRWMHGSQTRSTSFRVTP